MATLLAILGVLLQLIPFALLLFLIWGVMTISDRLGRIEALLSEVVDRLPGSAAAD